MREQNLVAVALIVGAFILLGAASAIAVQGSKTTFVVFMVTTFSLVWSITQGAKGVTMGQGARFNTQAQFGLLGVIGIIALVTLTVFKV